MITSSSMMLSARCAGSSLMTRDNVARYWLWDSRKIRVCLRPVKPGNGTVLIRRFHPSVAAVARWPTPGEAITTPTESRW